MKQITKIDILFYAYVIQSILLIILMALHLFIEKNITLITITMTVWITLITNAITLFILMIYLSCKR